MNELKNRIHKNVTEYFSSSGKYCGIKNKPEKTLRENE
jgi:hypothetical protein